jgi:pyrimidine 5'-nucleotidase
VHTFFLDLDDTLYPPENGLWAAIRTRIDGFIQNRLGLSSSEAAQLRAQLSARYGTTLRGLEALYDVQTEQYLDFVHDVRVSDFVRPDPALAELLRTYPQRKIVLTNSSAEYALRVLAALGVQDCLERIIDINDLAPYCKPQPQAYALALRLAGEKSAEGCAVFDDLETNLQTAHAMGFFTVLVSPSADGSTGVFDAVIPSLHALPQVIPPDGGSWERGA